MSRCVRADHLPSGTEPPGACVQALARRCAAAHAHGHRACPHPIGVRGRRVLSCPVADHERGQGSVCWPMPRRRTPVRTQADFEPAADDAADVRREPAGVAVVSAHRAGRPTPPALQRVRGARVPTVAPPRGPTPCPAVTAHTSSPRIQENDNARERVTAPPTKNRLSARSGPIAGHLPHPNRRAPTRPRLRLMSLALRGTRVDATRATHVLPPGRRGARHER
jgi:hypothetical protein